MWVYTDTEIDVGEVSLEYDRLIKELELLERDTKILENITKPFQRIKYTEALKQLQDLGSDIKEGQDLGGDDETILSKEYNNLFFITHYPAQIKAFYMNRDKDDGLDGVRFHFVKKGENDIKRLTYFSCDISDDGFEEDNPELLIYLNSMRECNTFVKSASYLMHYRSFKNIRNLVLDKSLSIFQDDTGLPYKHVDNDDWNIRYFGSYVKPIKDFEKNYNILFQHDLEKRY